MTKYKRKPAIVDADLFMEGMEDKIVYHIALFGLFTKQECIDAGFTPDFEKDKIHIIKSNDCEYAVAEGKHYIVTRIDGERYPVDADEFHGLYDLIEE